MTPLFLQKELKSQLEQLLKLQLTAQNDGFNVFLQSLPSRKDAKDDSAFPYCCITLGDGEQNQSDATQDIIFTFGVKDKTTDYQGYQDIVNVVESVRQYLIENQEIAKHFTIQQPIKWVIPPDESVYPYYFGAVIATYSIPLFIPKENQYI